ncbi:Glycogen accumulation regulator GarA [Stieleria maiorica]|uniref:Glycogen accumulation regulator GarA n=1 Tax=Stieleria maiorica TaxID=2795974 RepID=A0A5B9MQT7_9BACT|nr:FHA domain-containing protein [Stieleria maiorica]QEG02106.1 Glycogen accumulation regulator GarA [Stieleria maiorica]
MSVELIITQGSNAGTAAPIHQGYYLVGRLKECQIRPKSRSVSRRHCLLLHNEDGFGALDLKSTRGTYVNGTKLVPHQWCVLADGDELRFGKVVFKVSVKQPAFAASAAIPGRGDNGGDTNAAESEPPISWNNQDVTEFLELEDQIDFDFGYGPDENGSDSRQADIDDDALAEEIADANVLADSAIRSGKPQDTFIGEVADEIDDESNGEKEIEVDSKPKKRPPRQKIDHKQYKRAARRSFNLPSFSLRSGEGYDWKLLGTVTLVVATLGLLGYQLYQFGSPTNVEIRQDLD